MSDYNEVKDNLTGILMNAKQSICPTDVDDISDALNLIETQQARIAELEKKLAYIEKGEQATIAHQRVKIDELTATVERLRIAALNAISIMSGGQAKADLRDAYDDTPEQNLNAVRREVYADGYYDGFTDCRSYDFDSSAECEDMALHNADEKANKHYPDKNHAND